MAGVWFLLVAVSFGQVLGISRNCFEDSITSCDECIRCGGTWCLDPKTSPRCSFDTADSWCSSNRLRLDITNDEVERGTKDGFNPKSYKQFVPIRSDSTMEFTYNKEFKKIPEIKFVDSSFPGFNSTDSSMFEISLTTDELTVTALGRPKTGFCPADGRVKEYVTYKMLEHGDAATMTFEVPCACSCSSNVEVKSKLCNARGNYSCNACSCEFGWSGKACEVSIVEVSSMHCNSRGNFSLGACHCELGWTGKTCEIFSGCDRGDIGDCGNEEKGICSNNGYCDCKRGCICNMTIEGSQYFDNHCTDICTSTSYCDSCLKNTEPGNNCADCQHIFVNYVNTSRLNDRDENNKKVWMNCTEDMPEWGCKIKYVAKKDSTGTTHVMILEPCNSLGPIAAPSTLKVTVPAVLGVLAFVAASAAVAGYMVWKGRMQPVPLNEPGYTNVDAEDCTGINPLYISPKSSYNNPMYGKK